jgi:ribonuclease J
LLLSDSTNVDVVGRAGGERLVATALRTLIERQRNRVVVGMFPSNVYRLKTLAEIAIATGRKLCLLGRSAQNHMRAATELGRMNVRHDVLVSPDRLREIPRSQVLVVASGTQAEPKAALCRLAAGDHPRMNLEAGDTVIFSSRVIPGNERAVWSLLCDLERRGAYVHFSKTDPDIHVSGHACRDEQTQMIQWVQPKSFIPVHGTYHHLRRHAALARSLGVRDVSLIENGQTALIDAHGLSEGASVPVGRVCVVDGREITDEVLRERTVMGEVGAVFVTVPVDRFGALTGKITVAARGVLIEGDADKIEAEARSVIESTLRDLKPVGNTSSAEATREAVRRAARKVYARSQPKPMVVVTLREG